MLLPPLCSASWKPPWTFLKNLKIPMKETGQAVPCTDKSVQRDRQGKPAQHVFLRYKRALSKHAEYKLLDGVTICYPWWHWTELKKSQSLWRYPAPTSRLLRKVETWNGGRNLRHPDEEKETNKVCTSDKSGKRRILTESVYPWDSTADSLTQDALSDDESLIANSPCCRGLLKVSLLFWILPSELSIKINEPQFYKKTWKHWSICYN
jgi:hypothetical protein